MSLKSLFSCEFQGINSDLAQDFCWIHGTSYIPPQYQPHMKCIVELEGVESEDDAPDTAYYQWVTFFMAIQASVVTNYSKNSRVQMPFFGLQSSVIVHELNIFGIQYLTHFLNIFGIWFQSNFSICDNPDPGRGLLRTLLHLVHP